MRNVATNRLQRCEKISIAQQNSGAAVVQDGGQLAALQPNVKRDQHRSDERDGEVRFQRQQSVARQHGNPIFARNAGLLQSRPERVHPMLHLGVAEAPTAVDFGRAVAICDGVAGKKFQGS